MDKSGLKVQTNNNKKSHISIINLNYTFLIADFKLQIIFLNYKNHMITYSFYFLFVFYK